MAENKKGFVLYCDLIHTVKKMPKNKIADLFLTILSYVNDENPVVNDLLVGVVFEPIKLQLKRDLVKYEHTKEKRSAIGKEGGIKSGEKRRLLSETKKSHGLQISDCEQVELEIEANEAIGSICFKNEANEAVIEKVTDTVTVTDTDKVNVIKKSAIAQHTQEEIEKFKSFSDWVDLNAPRIKQFKQPFTIPEYLRLIEDFDKHLIKKTLLAMQNWVDLTKKKPKRKPNL